VKARFSDISRIWADHLEEFLSPPDDPASRSAAVHLSAVAAKEPLPSVGD
jgi:hypothetical protein